MLVELVGFPFSVEVLMLQFVAVPMLVLLVILLVGSTCALPTDGANISRKINNSGKNRRLELR